MQLSFESTNSTNRNGKYKICLGERTTLYVRRVPTCYDVMGRLLVRAGAKPERDSPPDGDEEELGACVGRDRGAFEDHV